MIALNSVIFIVHLLRAQDRTLQPRHHRNAARVFLGFIADCDGAA
jgi:hypothetical protein